MNNQFGQNTVDIGRAHQTGLQGALNVGLQDLALNNNYGQRKVRVGNLENSGEYASTRVGQGVTSNVHGIADIEMRRAANSGGHGNMIIGLQNLDVDNTNGHRDINVKELNNSGNQATANVGQS